MINLKAESPRIKMTHQQFEALTNWAHKRIQVIISQHLHGDCPATQKAIVEEFAASDALYEIATIQPGDYDPEAIVIAIRAAMSCLDSEVMDHSEFATVVRKILNVKKNV